MSDALPKNPGNAKGGVWVWAQGFLILAYILAHYAITLRLPRGLHPVGLPLMAYGAGMAIASILKLGRNLTPFPKPPPGASLVRTGPYAWVRNPIYSGLSALAFGYALWMGDGARLIAAVALFVFLDRKSASEEKWLLARFPEYPAYRAKVRKLIPFLY